MSNAGYSRVSEAATSYRAMQFSDFVAPGTARHGQVLTSNIGASSSASASAAFALSINRTALSGSPLKIANPDATELAHHPVTSLRELENGLRLQLVVGAGSALC